MPKNGASRFGVLNDVGAKKQPSWNPGGIPRSRHSPQSGRTRSAPTGNGCVARRPDRRVLRDRPIFDRHQRLAVLAIEEEQEAVAAHHGHALPRPAGDLRVVQHRRDREIRFPDVVAERLVMPAQLPGLHVQRNDGAEIEVVAGAHFAAMLRHAVSGDEVDQAEIRIGGAHQPDRAAAGLPRIVALGPRLVARLSRTGNDVELPDLTSGLRVERDRLAPEAAVGVEADEHEPGRVGRRAHRGLPTDGGRIADVLAPGELAGFLLERDHLCVGKSGEHQSFAERDALLRRRALRLRRRAWRWRRAPRLPAAGPRAAVLPQRLAGLGVQRIDRGAGGHEHDPVLHDRGGSRGAGLEFRRSPGAPEAGDGLRVDPIQRRIAAVVPIASGDRPLGAGGLAPVVVGRRRQRREAHQQRRKQEPAKGRRNFMGTPEMTP